MFTWLYQPDVEYFLYLGVVGGDVEDALRRILDTRDVNWHQILRYLLPLDGAGTARRHVEHLCPQPAHIETVKSENTSTHSLHTSTPSCPETPRPTACTHQHSQVREHLGPIACRHQHR